MDVAIIGAGGVCGRQLLFMLLSQGIVPRGSRLQLVGHRGGSSERELWGLRADAADAFDESAPDLQIVLDAEEIDARIVVMMAGMTVSTDPDQPVDRAALGAKNAEMFEHYAQALAARGGEPPIVVVQSNPVELAVRTFSDALPRHLVLGAAGFSDSLRFGREIAKDLGLHRRDLRALALGQHGDLLVPLWSQVKARGVTEEQLAEYIAGVRAGRDLAQLPDEIRDGKAKMLELVRAGDVSGAYSFVQALPADVRFGVKPFFTHFTAGRTTEAATAHSAAWLVGSLINGYPLMVSAQVRLTGEWEGLNGVTAVPVVLSPTGWSRTVAMDLDDDERALLARAVAAVG